MDSNGRNNRVMSKTIMVPTDDSIACVDIAQIRFERG
jgi:hypothetical protein